MTKFINNIPEWVQMLIAVGTLIFSLAFAMASAKGDLRVETSERKGADSLIDERQQHYDKSIDELKQMFQQELDRHHPRH